MARFIYFIPGLDRQPLDSDLDKAGLSHLIGTWKDYVGSTGPTDKGGAIIGGFYKVQNGVLIGYYKERQTWQEFNDGKFWIGYQNDSKPKSEDLEKEDMLIGYEASLADGNKWMIPVARRFESGCVLPQSLFLDGAGVLRGEILDKFVIFSKQAEDIFDDFACDMEKEKDYKAKVDTLGYMFKIATEALSINYYVSKWEISILRLLTTENSSRINLLIIDFPSLKSIADAEKELKKKV